MNTQGHLGNNGGLRGHSVGDIFPYIIVAVGKSDNLAYYVQRPDGTKTIKTESWRTAYSWAKTFKRGV